MFKSLSFRVRARSEWDERSDGQAAPAGEQLSATSTTTTTRRFLCDVHRPVSSGRKNTAEPSDPSSDAQPGDALTAGSGSGAMEGEGGEGERRNLGAISKTGKR